MASGSRRQQPKASTHKLENQLRETLQRYELIFKATNDVLYELDLQTGTVIWNEALYTQYGYSKQEKANSIEWWTGHIHPDDALQLEHEITQWFEGKQNTWQAEYRFRKADGNYIFVRDRGMVQRKADSTPLRIIGSFLDITKQKQLDRAKNEFISLVSHQLRTPLTTIRIYSQMLTDGFIGPLSRDQEQHIEQITDASTRLIKLVGDILNISRIESGHITSEPVPTSMNNYLQAHLKAVQPLTAEKDIALQFNPNPKIKKVLIDTTIFDQIVHNLLTNAIRYSKPSKGIIEITFDRADSGYLLSVKDNGIGIPKAAQPHIFNRFYRASNTTNIEEQGTGLGLYLVKLMAETAGCKVWFKSTSGKGATFYVQLPLRGMKGS